MNEVVEPIMKKRGIEIMTFFDVDRIDPQKRAITSIEGDSISYDLPIVIPAFIGAKIEFAPANVVDPDRYVITDKETLRIRVSTTPSPSATAPTFRRRKPAPRLTWNRKSSPGSSPASPRLSTAAPIVRSTSPTAPAHS